MRLSRPARAAEGGNRDVQLATIDIVVVIAYAIAIFLLAQYVSRERKGHKKDTSDYFLASKNLPWWAIGASLIAANISAEQFVGMSVSGFAIGLAIASYDWLVAVTLLGGGGGGGPGGRGGGGGAGPRGRA